MLVGGFLGAGKTTLLWQTAQALMKQGLKVGLITNDQAPDLVDTQFLKFQDLKVSEVSGSCFCCNFNGFTDAIQKIKKDQAPDIILAEPVGSCTDLSATILQPIKKYWKNEIEILPLSVLADPNRLDDLLHTESSLMHPDAAYILEKQLEESDLILINKVDLLSPTKVNEIKESLKTKFPSAKIVEISAKTSSGIDNWLEKANNLSGTFANKILSIDYDKYANGEAIMGWLNGNIIVSGKTTNWNLLLETLMKQLSEQFDSQNLTVGHVKMIGESEKEQVIYNLTGTGKTLSVRGGLKDCEKVKLTINARVETSPDDLNQIIRSTVESLSLQGYMVEFGSWHFLTPGRPEPTYRFVKAV